MPLGLPITAEARHTLAVRIPVHKPYIDGTDAAGLVQIALDAIEKLEARIDELEAR